MKKFILLLGALTLMILMFTACGKKQSTEESNVIKIGVFEPVTGANAGGAKWEIEGIKLANKLYPEVLGKKIELVIVDNKSDKVEAANAAARLVDKEKVAAIIGSYGSSLSMAGGETFKNSKVPAVAASATNPMVTVGNDFYSRVCFIDPFQGTVMANYAFNQLKAKKVAIVQEVSNDYAVGLAKFFTDDFKKLTGDDKSILTVANYNTGDTDFTAQLTNIKGLNPDVIFAPGNFTESAALIKQARQLGITVPIIGGDTWETQEFIDIGGKEVEGAIFSTFFDAAKPATKETEKFLQAFKKEFPDKEPAGVSALGYDAYLLIIEAIKRANSTDPEKIKEEINKTKDFMGAAGVVNFDENRNAIKSAVIKQVKDGKFVYLDTVEPKK
ncbi:MAG: ABC transporter substrate-binding protein [Fusobacteriaceae bacterium]|nr:ABC transporter substrate-binding protein [Fusobacteriaceae bacterium]MBN2838438.1 ABC transporter substrate-binding protein [Fusobacteriaceae bacterium]